MNLMKHLLTAIACCLAVAGSAQTDAYPYNPDSDGDGLIGVEDLLSMLSEFGTEAQLQTCFKGDICGPYAYNSSVTNFTPSGCGTIVAKTNNFNNLDHVSIYVTSEGYQAGDVIHLIQDYRGGNETATYYTLIDEEWVYVTYTSSSGGQYFSSIIFDGAQWEPLSE